MKMNGVELLAGVGLGMGLGAGLSYLFDPQSGPRRRDRVRDRADGWWHDARDGVESLAADVQHRAAGLWQEAREGAGSLSAADIQHRAAGLAAEVRDRVSGMVEEVRSRAARGDLSGLVRESGLLRDSWSPTTRTLVGLAGCGLLGYGFRMNAPWACVVGSVGLGLMAESLTNRGVSDMIPDAEAVTSMGHA